MWSGSVEVPHILAKHPTPVTLVQDNEVIKALAAKAPDKPLADRMGPRRLEGGAEHLNPAPYRHPGERRAEFRVVVANEIGGRAFPN